MPERAGVTFKLWLAFVALVLMALLPPGVALNRMLTQFYHRQVTDPLVFHAERLAEMLAAGPHMLEMAPMMGQMAGAEVYAVDAAGRPYTFAGAAAQPPPAATVRQALAGERVLTRVRGKGAPTLVVAVPVPGPAGPGGAVVLMAPAEPLEQALAAARRVMIAAAAGALLLAGGLALLLSRTLALPLVRMEQAARRMAQGQFDTRVPVRGRDEVGRLGEAINALAAGLQRYEQHRREFLANVAHELRTPLTYLRGYSGALADGLVEAAADRERHLQIIHEEAVRLGRLVDDLMELAAMEEGGALALALDQVELRGPVGQAVGAVQPQARDKGITLAWELPPDLPPVWADGARVQQVLLNLLDNALRHTPAGGQVRVVAAAEPPGRVRVSVRDSGPGIPPDQLEAIWERFHKADRSRAGGGRGLGLAVVRSIVRAHGGEVGARNHPGGGAVFWFTLPTAP